MKKKATTPVKTTERSYAEAKKRGRTEHEKEYGPRLDTNMHADTQERLVEIAGWLDGEDYTHLTKGRGNVFRKSIGDLVNFFYIDYIYEPTSKEAKLLIELYMEFYKLKEEHSEDEILTILSQKYPTPLAIGQRKTEISEKKWNHKHIERLSNFRWIIQTLEELDGKARISIKKVTEKK